MKSFVFTSLFTVIVQIIFAQDFVDNALLFSRTQPGGSARMQAIGGAQVALGGDYSSALSNPAGIGMFNRSEITFSMAVSSNSTASDYTGNVSDDNRTIPTVPGFSLVFKSDRQKEKYLGGAFAFTYSRINNFNTRYFYEADNSQSSLIDYFIDDTFGRDPNQMLAGGADFYSLTALAYNNYLIQDFINNNGQTEYGSVLSPFPADPDNNIPAEIRTIRQSEEVLRKGAQNQISFSYGGNYDDTFFFGASLGIATLRFKQNQLFRESNFRYNQDTDYNPIDYFETNEDFTISGSGMNLTLGAIYRPIDFMQIGASLVTPTFYTMTDSYTASISSQWNNFDYYLDGSEILSSVSESFDVPLISEYNITTPAKYTVGAAFISKYGFISADVEFVNHSKVRYSSNTSGESYRLENDGIKTEYTNVVNYRVGAEYRYEIFRLRTGYSFQSDPYRTSINVERDIHTFSAGVGIRTSSFFLDVAAVHTQSDSRRVPYRAAGLPIPVVDQKNRSTNYTFTVGFPF